jgi:hypothetical protein
MDRLNTYRAALRYQPPRHLLVFPFPENLHPSGGGAQGQTVALGKTDCANRIGLDDLVLLDDESTLRCGNLLPRDRLTPAEFHFAA